MERDSRWALPLAILITVAAAVLGGLSSADAAERYQALEQPDWAPPSWLFGPVWTLLYAGLAFAGWGIWRREGPGLDSGLWLTQMFVNAWWSPLFFAWEMRLVALVWILLLDGLVLMLIIRNWRLGWPAWLLVPYMAWITFATLLNASVWWLNR